MTTATCDRYDPLQAGICDRPLDEAGRCNIAVDHDIWEALPQCFHCGSTDLHIVVDEQMSGMTDVCICISCNEIQDDTTTERVANRG